MKPLTLAGIVLIVVGLAVLIYPRFNYTTTETVLDIGPITATAERERTVRLPTAAGVVAVLGGVALVVAGARKR